jgi:hypothetical protein
MKCWREAQTGKNLVVKASEWDDGPSIVFERDNKNNDTVWN